MWFNLRYEEQRYTEKVPFHAFCLLGLRADADEATRAQAKAILRAYQGPKGKKALPVQVGTVKETGVAAAK